MKCRVCKCTHERACDNSCGWATEELCTNCAKMAEALREYAEVVYRFSAAALLKEMKHGPRRRVAGGRSV